MSGLSFEPEAIPEGTPVEVWAPAFHAAGFAWLDTMPAGEVLTQFRHGTWCRLCELNEPGDKHAHARRHRAEYRRWKEHKNRVAQRASVQALKTTNRLRRETRQASTAH